MNLGQVLRHERHDPLSEDLHLAEPNDPKDVLGRGIIDARHVHLASSIDHDQESPRGLRTLERDLGQSFSHGLLLDWLGSCDFGLGFTTLGHSDHEGFSLWL
jgi:hypothetical protein